MSSEGTGQRYYILRLGVSLLHLVSWGALAASALLLLITLATGSISVNSTTMGAIESGAALLVAALLTLLTQAVRLLIDMEENTRRSYRAIEELIAEIKLQNEPVLFEVEETPIDIAADEIT